MMSATARAQRRGALSQFEFRAEMDRRGFIELNARNGNLHEFMHPDCFGAMFLVTMDGESYSQALARLTLEKCGGKSRDDHLSARPARSGEDTGVPG
jgi:hypothetical protein